MFDCSNVSGLHLHRLQPLTLSRLWSFRRAWEDPLRQKSQPFQRLRSYSRSRRRAVTTGRDSALIDNYRSNRLLILICGDCLDSAFWIWGGAPPTPPLHVSRLIRRPKRVAFGAKRVQLIWRSGLQWADICSDGRTFDSKCSQIKFQNNGHIFSDDKLLQILGNHLDCRQLRVEKIHPKHNWPKTATDTIQLKLWLKNWAETQLSQN